MYQVLKAESLLNINIKPRCLVVLLLLASPLLHAQSAQADSPLTPQRSAQVLTQTSDGKGYTLRVTTREVVVEVVARDRHDRPVNDLKRDDFTIFEGARQSGDDPKVLSGFRIIDPANERTSDANQSRSVVLPLGGRCEIRSTVHYEIAFHPTKWAYGYHSILVTTRRRGIKLAYRSQYYVGISEADALPAPRGAKALESALLRAACFHPDVPPSLSLSATKMAGTGSSQLSYSVTILPGSLDFARVNEDSHHVQLEYGVCAFSSVGQVLGFWRFSEDRSLSPADIGRVLIDGWAESVEVPRKGNPALVRLVVLEPKSGNLGTEDISTDPTSAVGEAGTVSLQEPTRVLVSAENFRGGRTNKTLLGSPVPIPGSFCGDVYELPTTTHFLPDDFKVLNAVGAVYANSLNVSEQIVEQGIPGSTSRSEWFGIDYYGEFWVTNAGKYLFALNADDGADLYIDDRKVISNDGIHPPQTASESVKLEAGRHTIHLPYFQGPTYVNLILEVKPPGEDFKVFDTREFTK